MQKYLTNSQTLLNSIGLTKRQREQHLGSKLQYSSLFQLYQKPAQVTNIDAIRESVKQEMTLSQHQKYDQYPALSRSDIQYQLRQTQKNIQRFQQSSYVQPRYQDLPKEKFFTPRAKSREERFRELVKEGRELKKQKEEAQKLGLGKFRPRSSVMSYWEARNMQHERNEIINQTFERALSRSGSTRGE